MRILLVISLLCFMLLPGGCVWLGDKIKFTKPVNPYTNSERRRPCGNPQPGQEVTSENPNCRASGY